MAEQTQRSLPSPFFIPTLFWVLGISLASFIHLPFIWLSIIGLICIIAALCFKYRLPFLVLVFLLAGFLRLNIAINQQPSSLIKVLSEKESITQPFSGTIIKVINDNHETYLVKITSIKKIPLNDLAIMRMEKRLIPGDRFEAIARMSLRVPDIVLDKANFYQAYRLGQTQIDINQVKKLTLVAGKRIFPLERWRYHLLEHLNKKMGDAAPFAKALLLNDRTEDRDWVQQLVQGGLLHLIAISGLHVLLFYFVFVTILNVFLPKRIAELLFLVFMLIYAGLCQWSAPVMRAIIMIFLYVVSRILQRKASPLQVICLSLFIITLVDPVQLFSVGLQLSCLCVLILAYAIPSRSKENIYHAMWKRRLLKAGFYFWDMALVSIIITLVLLPLMMFYFQKGSFNGIIGNLGGIPFMGFLLPLTFALMLIPSDWLLFQWLKASFDVLYLLFQKWVAWVASLPIYIDAVSLSLPMLITLYLLITVIIIRLKSGIKYRKLSYVMLACAFCIMCYSLLPQQKKFTLIVFNAGLGDCSLIRYPNGQTIMIDTGPKTFSAGKKTKGWFAYKPRNWFKHNKITTIDVLVLSHLDADHSGGLDEAFRSLLVRNLFISRQAALSPKWQKMKEAIPMDEARIIVISDTLSFDFANSRISFLHPDKAYKDNDDNDNSLVMRLDYKDFSALFPGDISTDTEKYLIQKYTDKLDCDFLKVPHHGSKYSSSDQFIRAVSPEQAVITAPLQNRFHFPDKETMIRYGNFNIVPQLTGNGSVIINIR